jgi:uncharacterized protein
MFIMRFFKPLSPLSTLAAWALVVGTVAGAGMAQAQVTAPGSAPAAAPAAAPAPLPSTAAKKELVARLLQTQQVAIENVGRGLAANTSQQVLEAASGPVGSLNPNRQEAVGKAVQDDVKKFYDEIEPMLKASAAKVAPSSLGTLLEQRMTEDELKQVVTWLESPVSKKYQLLAGDMEGALGQQVIADTRGAIEPKLKALEDQIRQRLQAAGYSGQGGASPAKPAPKTQPAQPKK